MRAGRVLIFALISLLVVACAPVTAPAPAPAGNGTVIALIAPAPTLAAGATPTPEATIEAAAAPQPSPPYVLTSGYIVPGWQIYTNPAGFVIDYPANWTAKAQPDMNTTGNIHTVALKGPEGEIDLNWGTSFGDVCPSGSTITGVAMVSGGYIRTCYWKNVDGTESWIQPSWTLPNASFSFRAVTSNAQPAGRELILKILSTLTTEPLVYAPPTPTPVGSYSDPFTYCAAVTTIDAPDARYTGSKTPASILPAGPWPLGEGSAYWRCMDNEVYACYVGANTPCGSKANGSTTPTEGMLTWCKDNPDDTGIPAYVVGRETIYDWSCKDGMPVAGHQRFHVDAQGYPAEYWQPIPSTYVLIPAVVPMGWRIYTNPAEFAISYPASWTAQPQPNAQDRAIYTETLKGPEGEVDLSWGAGFGGACPQGYTAAEVAQGDIQACYAKNADGTESWAQLSHALPKTGFQGRAVTSNGEPASHDTLLQILSTLTFDPGPPPDLPGSGYPEPFGYCAALGTIEYQDARYLGPKTPDSITAGLAAALKLPATPAPFLQGSVYWRCMGGDVYACAVGANIPCWDKANTSTEPTPEMQTFCKDQPNADAIPASVTGRETIYAWSCKDGAPAVGQRVHQVDADGYIVDYWYEIPPTAAVMLSATPGPTPRSGTLQALSDTECAAIASGMAQTLGIPVTRGGGPINGLTQSGGSCFAIATATGVQFGSPDAVVKKLGDMLGGMGWIMDPKLVAESATGHYQGYRKGAELCWADATWWPSPDANCPENQLLSDCNATPAQQDYTVVLNCARSSGTATP